MAAEMSPGGVIYKNGPGGNMLPTQPQILQESQANANARLNAGSDSFKREMAKQYGGAGAAAQAAVGQASDDATSVAKENYNARMAEASVRAQLHSSYMDVMWGQFRMNQKADRWGQIGAALGAAGMIGASLFGGPVAHPEMAGGAGALQGLAAGSRKGGGVAAGTAVEE